MHKFGSSQQLPLQGWECAEIHCVLFLLVVGTVRVTFNLPITQDSAPNKNCLFVLIYIVVVEKQKMISGVDTNNCKHFPELKHNAKVRQVW